ncbi:uncharacterized protein LOC106641575 [Copidosoma floridanum]|uniref:uncharacterized protein LOC106641575 n=1 Tax=Copidosoma floridanum TaxID=29053 RepID=UPI0006C97D3B|nr:uncharacterized protein LOC106641575 [Copidosoma floridanum]
MADYSHRKSTVREALIGSNLLSSTQRVSDGKLRGRYLFRASVRLVMEYIEWIGSEALMDRENVTANVKLAKQRKASKLDLTVKDRSILLLSPDKRSKEDIEYARSVIVNTKAFKKYPEDIKGSLAAECGYQYVLPQRTVTRQGHEATALYYVVRGTLDIFKDVTDKTTGQINQTIVGSLEPGDMFGEIALLHNVPRTATVVSRTSIDLFVVSRSVFNKNLKNYLMEEWDVLRDAFVNFNYFKGWSEDTIRECCILSKVINYDPNEVLLGDGRGMVHYVYFILSGECRLVEHMLVDKKKSSDGKQAKYKLYDSQSKDKNPTRQRKARSKMIVDLALNDDFQSMILKNIAQNTDDSTVTAGQQASATDNIINLISSKKDENTNIAMERISVITVTLQDVINQWHEITDTVEMLMKRPSVTNFRYYPKSVETIFMQICILYRGACFGLGEQMKNRRIVSITPVKCLLIPRFWLTKHNRANVWERVKSFLNFKYPSHQELFHKFTNHKRWTEYKKNYVQKLRKEKRNLPNDTKYYDNIMYFVSLTEFSK